jgi:hypothetical protein
VREKFPSHPFLGSNEIRIAPFPHTFPEGGRKRAGGNFFVDFRSIDVLKKLNLGDKRFGSSFLTAKFYSERHK